jgi:hypothetical protein
MSNPMSFTLFPQLPAELRIKIWVLSLPDPRIVALNYSHAPFDPSYRTLRDQAMRGCTSPTAIPSILHTSREARHEALLFYNLSFNIHHGTAKIFFNPAIDVLYFGPKEGYLDSFKQFADASSMIVKSELANVKRLAVHENLFSQSNEHVSATRIKEFWEYVDRKFKNVEEVVILREMEKNCCLAGCGTLEDVEREGLIRRIERGLKFVGRCSVWKAPSWCVVPLQGDGFEGFVWPVEDLVKRKAERQPEIQDGGSSGSFDLAFWSAVL